MPANTKKMMAKLGQLYERLCSVPFVGEPLARSMSRNMGRMIFYLSGSDPSSTVSLGCENQDVADSIGYERLELIWVRCMVPRGPNYCGLFS